MNQELITQLSQSFNQTSHTWEGSEIEYWYARDLQKMLEYSDWRNFIKVIEKAKEACSNSGGKGFGRIRSRGDAALFGGNTTQSMKNKLSVPKSRALADFLPTVTIAAKNLATEITNHNVRQNDLQGERSITDEHVQNNKSLRDMLAERGIKPEELPAEEDLKKLERRVKSDEKRLIKAAELPKDAKEEK